MGTGRPELGTAGAPSPYEIVAAARAYAAHRRADPRIEAYVHAALGDARSLVNVGAGAGAYEPCDRAVLAIEPSARMIGRRPPGCVPTIQGHAEALPLPSGCVDAAMACMTLHHWADWRLGVQELRRVARRRVVVLTYDRSYNKYFWLLRDYLPQLGHADMEQFPDLGEQCAALGEEVAVEPVPIPHDCKDSFLGAFWRRPRAYLDEKVRAAISAFHLPGASEMLGGLAALARDLDSGEWEERNRELLGIEELDLGYRLLVTEL